MILTLTFLVVALLHPAQPTVVTELHQPDLTSQSVQLHPQPVNGIQLGESHPTIVKTFKGE